MKIKTVLFFLLLFGLGWSQTKTIKGVVKAENASVEGIHVLNLVTEKATITDANGVFYIEVSEDDLLVFSAVHLHYWRKSISKEIFQTGFIEIQMTAKVNELDEVVVSDYSKVTAQSVGVINYKPKSFTPAERRLYTANSGLLDPLLNWISGRTKLLKKELEIEKREKALARLSAFFPNTYFKDTLKIPEDYIEGFKYYAVEDKELFEVLQLKDKLKTAFILSKLANEFIKYLPND
ncbi:hypothetical protein [Flavobacterium sp.]|uniref:hypothetical protein n=1 Tax=Flavobacterium sp. TaxID=239 RepID=UPI002FD89A8E